MKLRSLSILATAFLSVSAFIAVGCGDDDDNASPNGQSSSGGTSSGGTSGTSGGTGGTSSGDGGGGTRLWFLANSSVPKVHQTNTAGEALFEDEPPGRTADIAIGGGAAWVITEDGKLLKYDLATPAAKPEAIEIAKKPSHVAFAGGSVWVTEDNDGVGDCTDEKGSARVIRWDPATKAVVKSLPVRATEKTGACNRFDGLVATETAVYPLVDNAFGVARIDVATNAITARMPLGTGEGYGVGNITIASNGTIWVVNTNAHFATTLDPVTLEAKNKADIPAKFDLDIAATPDALYVASDDTEVLRIDAANAATQSTGNVASRPDTLVAHGADIYVTAEPASLDLELIAIDPKTLTELERTAMPGFSSLDRVVFE